MAILNQTGGYAVVEVNKLTSRVTGDMVANAPLATDFTCSGKDGASQTYAEQGMILAYDPTNTKGNQNGAIVANTMSSVAPISYGVVFATEHMYNTYANSLKDFRMDRPIDPNSETVSGDKGYFQFYPRLYSFQPTDAITTNAVDLGTYTLETLKTALESGTAIYGECGAGYTKLVDAASDKTFVKVEKITTCPNGIDPAIKFRFIDSRTAK